MKTKLDIKNPQHQILVGTLTMFIDNFGYSPRELFELIEDSKNQLWFTFQEMANENKEVKGE
jgi:hypothetical protein